MLRTVLIIGTAVFAAVVLNFTIERYGIREQNFLGADSDAVVLVTAILIMLGGVISGSAYRVVRGTPCSQRPLARSENAF